MHGTEFPFHMFNPSKKTLASDQQRCDNNVADIADALADTFAKSPADKDEMLELINDLD